MSDPAVILRLFQRLYEAMDELDNNLADGTDDEQEGDDATAL